MMLPQSAFDELFQAADKVAVWCHGETFLRDYFPELWQDLADLEQLLGKLEEQFHLKQPPN